ncbi:sulfur carrier protein ThiS [Marinilabiliaceae bacterium JC017]|nr:sulfur carrier protein ThiS [Marinilabiliaceae bacterium JC017]
MTIFFNGQEMSVGENLVVDQFLLAINQQQKGGIAIAINNKVVPKTEWDQFKLSEGDKILVIKASQGG